MDKHSNQSEQAAHPNTIVMISANAEWRAVREYYSKQDPQTSPYGEWFQVAAPLPTKERHPTHSIQSGISTPHPIFLHGGWGKIAAAASAQYAIDRWRPRLLVNMGTCGGFAGLVERGEILLAEKTLVYDIIEQMGDPDEAIAHYTTEIDLSWLREPYPQKVRRSLLVSADRDLLPADISWLQKRFEAVAGDWESGAIAYVAARNHIPTLILRGVTDLVSDRNGEAYGQVDLFHRASREVMHRLLAALPAWLQASSL